METETETIRNLRVQVRCLPPKIRQVAHRLSLSLQVDCAALCLTMDQPYLLFCILLEVLAVNCE